MRRQWCLAAAALLGLEQEGRAGDIRLDSLVGPRVVFSVSVGLLAGSGSERMVWRTYSEVGNRRRASRRSSRRALLLEHMGGDEATCIIFLERQLLATISYYVIITTMRLQ